MSVLRNRNFAVLFSGQMVSVFGNNLFLLALPWFVYSVTGSKADLAIVGFAQSLPSLAGLFSGVFVDRWHKRATMIWSDLARCAISLGVFAMAIAHASFWFIAIMVLLLEFIGTFFNPASTTLLPLIIEEEQLPQAMGTNQSGNAAVQLLGQFGGGTLLSLFGAPILFLLNAFSFLVSVLSLGWLRVTENIAPTANRSFLKEWGEGFRSIIQSRLLLLIIIAALVLNFSIAPFDIALTAWIKGPLHENAFWLGAIGGAFFIGIMLGGICIGLITRVLKLKVILMAGFILSGLLIAGIGLYANVYYDAGLIFICGLVNGIINGSLGSLLIQVIPKEMRGRVFSTTNALGKLAMPLGLAVFGALMVFLPLTVIFILMGAMAVLSGLSFFIPVQDDLGRMRSSVTHETSAEG